MRRFVRGFGWLVAAVLAPGTVLAVVILLLVRTQPGHEYLLRVAVRQLSGEVNGQVEVGGVQAGSILSGFRLHGLTIRDAGGRPVIEADSLDVRYSFPDLIRRNIVLVPARIWAPRLTIEWGEQGVPSNIETLFRARGPAGGPPDESSGFSVVLRDVEIHEGEVVVGLPVTQPAGASRAVIETLPGWDRPVRVVRLEGIEGRVSEALLVRTPGGGQRVSIEDLVLTAHILDVPFDVTELRGTVTREGSEVTLVAERVGLGGSQLAGRVAFRWGGPDGETTVEAELESEELRLADLRWLEARLPDGAGPVVVRATGPLGVSEWRVSSSGFRVGASRVSGSAGLRLGGAVTLLPSEVELLPFDLADVEPWLPESLSREGWIRGRVSVSGELGSLQASGDVTYEDLEGRWPGWAARFDGGVGLDDGIRMSGLSLTLDPFRYESLAQVFPELDLTGDGRAEATLSGSLGTGLAIDGEIEHWTPESPRSRVAVRGTLREEADDLALELDGTLDLLSLDGLAQALARDLPVSGMMSGEVRAEGNLSDLSVSGRVVTPAGFVEASGRFDARDPSRAYAVEGSVEEFRLHALVPRLPDPTVVTGDFRLQGAGHDIESLSGNGFVSLRQSRIAGVELELLEGRVVALEGRITLDALDLRSPVLELSGSGSLPLQEGAPDGEVFVLFSTSSLAALRPALFGPDPIAADTLSQLERDLLVLEGVDPDTLSALSRIELDGSAEGEIRLVGSAASLSADGFVEVADLIYGATSVGSGRADFLGSWQRDGDWSAEGVVDIEAFSGDGFTLESASGELQYGPGRGAFRVDIRKDGNEAYRARGSLTHDSVAVDVALETLVLDIDASEWSLAAPTRVMVSGSLVRVDSFRVARPEGGAGRAARIEANGLLDLDEESDLSVRLEGVNIDLLAGILQTDRLPAGIVDLSLDVTGPASSPRMTAAVAIDDFSSGGAGLSRVEGTVEYGDQLLQGRLVGILSGSTRLDVEGRVPADLSLRAVDRRLLDREMDVTISVDSLPAATALAFLDVLEEVEGNVNGQIRLRGTPTDLRPSGEVRMSGGRVLLSELGIRPEDIVMSLTLREEGLVDVEGAVTSVGTARVSGTIDVADVSDPVFESLMVTAAGFQTVSRRDMVVRLGGDVRLAGRYSAPEVSGTVQVEQGELFLDEFARTTEVIDLTDPSLLEVLDTTFVGVRPAADAARNPFLQNLRVQVGLALQGDFWLRSREMNIEIGGNLDVEHARSDREVFLVGDLEPIRGTYDVVGKQFQVTSGTVQFLGTAGINPTLAIQAVTRLRREAGEPLDITANVEGTLVSPRVTLASDTQPPIAESDLVSYLIFGRPSYALASAETSVLRRAAGAGVTLGVGAVASSLGQLVGREVGFDYFSITQLQDGAAVESTAGLSGSLAYTQIEVGRYLGQDLFLALVVRPLSGFGAVSQTFPGARVEWRFTDTWSVEGFVEDRFAREATTGFGTLGVRLSKVLGLSLYREWGY